MRVYKRGHQRNEWKKSKLGSECNFYDVRYFYIRMIFFITWELFRALFLVIKRANCIRGGVDRTSVAGDETR